MRRTTFLTASFCFIAFTSMQAASWRAHSMRCEGMVNPMGIDNVTPRLSWQLSSARPNNRQTAYEIEVGTDSVQLVRGHADCWRSGRKEGAEHVMVAYGGKQLQPRRLYFWRVRAWDGRKHRSAWSEVARFSTGIAQRSDWKSKMVGLQTDSGWAPSPIVRSRVKLGLVKRGLLHVASMGYHEAYVNGQKVDHTVLQPAVSQLDRRTLSITYDVTALLREGDNDVVLWLSTGWYKEGTFGAAYPGALVMAELDTEQMDHTWHTVLSTSDQWVGYDAGRVNTGTWQPLRFEGERVEAARVPKTMNQEDLDRFEWRPLSEANLPDIEVSPQMCAGNVLLEPIKPVAITDGGEGRWMVDFGRCLTGWVRYELPPLAKGQAIRIEYSDHVDEQGAFVPLPWMGENDVYVSDGTHNEVFCNKFNHHAFRYVRIYGLNQAPEREQLAALPLTGVAATQAGFACSDKALCAVHDLVTYTMRCLTFSGYMVDCPHMERTGYGGDGNSSTMAVQTVYDAAPIFYNWMQAWQDAEQEGGSLPHFAPLHRWPNGGGPYWCAFVIQAPWRTYLNYGDDRLLAKHYGLMKDWLGYVAAHTGADGLLHRWPDTDYRSWYLGDWLAPKGINPADSLSVELVSNCAVSDALRTMGRIARHLGRADEAEVFELQRHVLNERIHKTFYNKSSHTYATGSQIDQCYPMLVGAVPEEEYAAVKARTLWDGHARWFDHVAMGLTGVPLVTEWAVREAEPDFIARMLRQTDYPGYGYMMAQSGTTTWEAWDGDRSRIHNCYNGITSWFYQGIGGLLPDEDAPGYTHVWLRPQRPEGVTWAEAFKETPHGRLALRWALDGKKLRYEATVPVGCTATLCPPKDARAQWTDGKALPQVESVEWGSGTHSAEFQIAP